MGRKFEYFPFPVCEEFDWLFLPLNERYLITKLEYAEINQLVVHCKDDFDHAYVVYDCSFEFLDHVLVNFSINVDVSSRNIRFKKTNTINFRFC